MYALEMLMGHFNRPCVRLGPDVRLAVWDESSHSEANLGLRGARDSQA